MIGGVAVTGANLSGFSSSIALGNVASPLAAVLPLARTRIYLLYAIVSTPLILLVLDIGRPFASALRLYRLIATVIGGVIVAVLNVLFHLLAAGAGQVVSPRLTPEPAQNLPGQ